MLTLVPREGFYTRPGLHVGMYARVLAACPPTRRGDASAGTVQCECQGLITFAREERTGLLRAACSAPQCFSVEG